MEGSASGAQHRLDNRRHRSGDHHGERPTTVPLNRRETAQTHPLAIHSA
jgi:hypothetical protein